jgi:hypothetical protein
MAARGVRDRGGRQVAAAPPATGGSQRALARAGPAGRRAPTANRRGPRSCGRARHVRGGRDHSRRGPGPGVAPPRRARPRTGCTRAHARRITAGVTAPRALLLLVLLLLVVVLLVARRFRGPRGRRLRRFRRRGLRRRLRRGDYGSRSLCCLLLVAFCLSLAGLRLPVCGRGGRRRLGRRRGAEHDGRRLRRRGRGRRPGPGGGGGGGGGRSSETRTRRVSALRREPRRLPRCPNERS